MRTLPTLIISLLLLIFFNQFAFAQCSTTTCMTPVPAINAQDACILPNPQALNCYYGATTPDLPQSIPANWCTDIDNNHWFAFTATSSLAFFTFTVYGCTVGHGIQVAVLSTNDCLSFQTVAACTGISDVSSQSLVAPGLIIGQVYYLCIDGTDGALCSYSINGADPTINLINSTIPCIPTVPMASYHTQGVSSWSINPPGAGTITGNPVSSTITVNWLQAGPAEVCAQNIACPGAPLNCFDVNVGGGETEEHVNLCEGKTVACAGQTFNTPGTYIVHFANGTNCDSTVKCIIQLIPRDTVSETHYYCQGDSVRCAGQYFNTPGIFPVLLQTPQGCDSLVKCQITVIPIDTTPVKVINLCGPANYTVCDSTYSSSGLFTSTCTSSSGCDSIVKLDLAILQPKAVLATPGVLGCDPNAIVTLFTSIATLNTALGGVTLYQWNGPGIIGPDNQQTVQVNKSGEYCLILTHGRDTLFCSDTACVTVTGSGSIPQAPLISGNQTPCANTTTIYTAASVGLPLATSYTWTTSGNISFVQLSPDSIAINWPDTTITGQICVTANDSCGASQPACIPVAAYSANSSLTVQICQGEELLIGGAIQSVSGIYSDTLQNINGCDSIRTITLIVNAVDTISFFQSTCIQAEAGIFVDVLSQSNGCDSLIITTVTFFPSDSTFLTSSTCNPADAGVFTQNLINHFGCDSTVISTMNLVLSDTTLLYESTCIATNTGVFVQHSSNQMGCDSTVITTVSLLPSDTTLISEFTCIQANVGVFHQDLTNQNGCDSVVVTTVNLLPSSITHLTGTSCNPAEVGVFTNILTNQFGCDSTVTTTVSFVPLAITLLAGTSCDPASTGVFTNHITTAGGCDSVVVTTISLLPGNQTAQTTTTCDPAQAGVFVYPLINQFGCDSIVTETRILLPGSMTTINLTTCEAGQVGSSSNVVPNQFGCDSTIVTITSLLPANSCSVIASLLGSNIPCAANTGTLTLTASVGTVPLTYSILQGTTTITTGTINALGIPQIISGIAPGNYMMNITSPNGFSTTAQAVVVQLVPPGLTSLAISDYAGFDISCTSASDGSAQAIPTGGLSPYTYSWSNGANTQQVTNLASGVYTVTVNDANGCTNVSTVALTEPTPLLVSLAVNDLNCFSENDGAIQVETSGGVPPYRYSINNSPDQASNIFTGLTSGTYTLVTSDANDCNQTEAIVLNAAKLLQVDLGNDINIGLGDHAMLIATVNVPLDSILSVVWTPPIPFDSSECVNLLCHLVSPIISTVYTIQVQALNGCTGQDNVTVIVDRKRQIYVPNIFSPNNDGANDLFTIYAKAGTVSKVVSLQVFDRWGDAIFTLKDFEPNSPVTGWDGSYKGEPMNPGVFVWVAEIAFIDGQREFFKGDVTIMR